MAKPDDDYRKDLEADDDQDREPEEFDDEPIDPNEIRDTLTKALTYRQIQAQVRRKSINTIFFGFFMLFIWYISGGQANPFGIFSILILSIAVLEVSVGCLNRFFPSLEGIMLEGIVVVAFGISSLIRQYLMMQAGANASPIFFLFGFFWIYQGIMSIRGYFQLKKELPINPSREHIRWFDQLERELRRADPKSDPLHLALPTKPSFAVKMLGDLCFMMQNGTDIFILNREHFHIVPHDEDANRGMLYLGGEPVSEFKLSQANWDNYRAWKLSRGESVPERVPVVRPIDRSVNNRLDDDQ